MQILMQTEELGNFDHCRLEKVGGFLSSYSETGPFLELHCFFLGLYNLSVLLSSLTSS